MTPDTHPPAIAGAVPVAAAAAGLRFDPTLSAPLREALLQALAGPYARVSRVEAGGALLWLKRVERLSLRWRLQKGDPRQALAAEREGLRLFAQLGVPVPRLMAEGEDFIATEAAGPVLTSLVGAGPQGAEALAAFAAAGRGLGLCHRAGLAHGRPKIRDICWDGETARFIDLERFDPARQSPRAMVIDLLILLHSICVETAAPLPLVAAVIEAWRAEAPAAVVARFEGVLPRLAPLIWLARQLRRLRPRSRELVAIDRLHQALLSLL